MRAVHTQLLAAILPSFAVLLVACQSASPPPSSSDEFVSPPSIPPPIPPSTGPLGPDAPCPGYDPPEEGIDCSAGFSATWDLTCEYGHDLDRRCNDIFECKAGLWRRLARPECFNRCPSTFEEIVPGAPCADTAVGCSYLEGTCACVPDGDAGSADGDADAPIPGTWRCAPPPEGGCPPQRPPLGSDCVRAMTCDYGACALARDVVYTCDVSMRRWVQADFPDCP